MRNIELEVKIKTLEQCVYLPYFNYELRGRTDVWEKISKDIFGDMFCSFEHTKNILCEYIMQFSSDKVCFYPYTILGPIVNLDGLAWSCKYPGVLFVTRTNHPEYIILAKSWEEVDQKYYKMLISNIDKIEKTDWVSFGEGGISIDIWTFFKYYGMHGLCDE